jgi:DNA invertase Pin-like site-specific DNA recombinase
MTLALRYRRVSGLGQEDNTSLEKQLEHIDVYCDTNGYESAPEYLFTEVMTGIETWRERPELQKLLSKAEQLSHLDESVVVVCAHPDRFARGMDLILLVELLLHYGVHCEFVDTKFEDTDEGHLVLHLESYTSKKEYDRIKRRTAEGRYDKVVKRHELLGGGRPLYGYRFSEDRTRYEYNEEERKVVERIFQMIKDGISLRRIAKIFTEEGVPTRKNRGYWRPSSIFYIASNPTYVGKFYAFRQTYKRNGQKYVPTDKPIEEQYLMPEGVCPPIIDEETFDIVQRQLAYNKEKSLRNNKHQQDAILRAGFIICGHCLGNMFVGHTKAGGKPYYKCAKSNARLGLCNVPNSISANIIDPIAWKAVCEIIRDPQKLKEKIEALRTPDPTEKDEIPLEIQKKSLEDEISEYVDLIHTAKTDSTKKKARAWIAHLEKQLQEIEAKEHVLANIKNNWLEVQKEIKRFENWCITHREGLDKAIYQDKRTCLEYLGVRVRVYRYGTRPRHKIDFTPPSILKKFTFLSKQS